MRFLLLHTDETIRAFLPDILAGWFRQAGAGGDFHLECEDGNRLDHDRVVGLLRKEYDCLIVNLRLPAMLSIRLAELAHLAKAPTRVILMSGAPEDLGLAVPLFDDYLKLPFSERKFPAALESTLHGQLHAPRRSLSSQEHLDIAILNLLHRCDSLMPGARGALHAFGMYRDRYLHRLPASWPGSVPLAEASLNQRVDFFAKVIPLDFCARLGHIIACVEVSKLLQPHQKKFLGVQFNFLLDAFGLGLLNFRAELDDVLRGLEQYARMVEHGLAAAEMAPAQLREWLLEKSRGVPYVSQGIARIVTLLPSVG